MDNIDINKLVEMIMGFMSAPTWKAVVVIIGVIALCILMIAKYFMDRNKREREAYEEALRIRKIQTENTQRMQLDASAALIDNMDTAYNQDYLYYIDMIGKKNYKAIYAKIAVQFHEDVAKIVYRDDLTPEQRSAMVINVIRKK